VRREAAAGSLKVVGLEPTLTRPLAIVHHRQRSLTPAINSFIEHMLKYGSAQGASLTAADASPTDDPDAVTVSG